MTGKAITAGIAIALSLTGHAAHCSTPKSPRPPRGAIVLFSGKDTNAWAHLNGNPVQWTVADGVLEVKPGSGNIVSRRGFADYRLHVEFATPYLPDAKSQARGNSGVYNHAQYEIQILDSYKNDTYAHGGCGAIYGQKDPDKNVCKPPTEWQTYDITFRGPRLDSLGSQTERPRLTLIWNGVKVHDDVEITIGPTTASLGGKPAAEGPIMLQDHGNKVRFRNIWILSQKIARTSFPTTSSAGRTTNWD